MIKCIDNDTKTCFFGYGGVTVNAIGPTIILTEIDPRKKPGTQLWIDDATKVGDWEYIGIPIHIHFRDISEINTVLDLLVDIDNNRGGSFIFEGVTFDFSNYDSESVRVARAAVEFAKKWLITLMAC